MNRRGLYSKLSILTFNLLLTAALYGQNLFTEECFVGGVTVAGRTSKGILEGNFQIHWDESFTIRRAYALTYRYDLPEPKGFIINGETFHWNYSNQVGSELPDKPLLINRFAVHVQDITDQLEINSNIVSVYMNGIGVSNGHPNQGWWSLNFMFLYERVELTDAVCVRLYTATQSQLYAQNYQIQSLPILTDTDVGFSIYSDRLTGYDSDGTVLGINGLQVGIVEGADATNPGSFPFIGGVRGHFYYENGKLYGLDDDVPNNTVSGSDGIAVINEYLTDTPTQNIFISAVELPAGANPHPAFFIAYTPDCPDLVLGDMPRQVSFCAGDSVQLGAMQGYDRYNWMPGHLVSDSTISNPWCHADSSMWLRVHMYNDADGGACSQTIPVFVTVNDIPRPGNLNIIPSTCPGNTGRLQALSIGGTAPYWHILNTQGQSSATFNNLHPGTYPYRITSATGCMWDITVTIPLHPPHEAAFTPIPPGGYTPLDIVFRNNSTNASGYQWLLNGEPISVSTHWRQLFADSGTYEIALIAYYNGFTNCTDTTYYTLQVDQGIELLVPNIITPNNDGQNDVLIAQLAGVSEIQWQVFNRWGQLLHQGDNKNSPGTVELWDGSEAPDGVYALIITAYGYGKFVKKMEVMVTLKR